MVLELHVWGPAFGLPSIDAACNATIAYFHRIVPPAEWLLIADYDTSISPREEFPVLADGDARITGFSSIVSYLRDHRSGAYNLDYHLTHQQQTDRTAFISFLESTAGPLVDLSLYVSSENYNTTTSSAYTAILPWHSNYSIPPRRRDLARARTAHLGLSSLDVSAAAEDDNIPGAGTSASEFENAKRAAGIPTEEKPKGFNLGRGKGIGGLLSSPVYAARFKLDTLSNELLEPLSDFLGKKEYLLEGDKPSSMDCLCFGYLALMFYAPVPQPWLKETIQTKYPRISRYIRRLRDELLGGEEINPAHVWAIATWSGGDAQVQDLVKKHNMRLPWRPWPPRPLLSRFGVAMQELSSGLPLISHLTERSVTTQDTHRPSHSQLSSLPSPLFINTLLVSLGAVSAGLSCLAIHHRRSPRDGDLIFWALRPSPGFGGLGEAGSILSVFANQLPRDAVARW